nr:helix-turn-helix domain-containing protein [Endozoicomonas sp.]
MLQGIRLKANPTNRQKLILSQWMGCARLSGMESVTKTVITVLMPESIVLLVFIPR